MKCSVNDHLCYQIMCWYCYCYPLSFNKRQQKSKIIASFPVKNRLQQDPKKAGDQKRRMGSKGPRRPRPICFMFVINCRGKIDTKSPICFVKVNGIYALYHFSPLLSEQIRHKLAGLQGRPPAVTRLRHFPQLFEWELLPPAASMTIAVNINLQQHTCQTPMLMWKNTYFVHGL